MTQRVVLELEEYLAEVLGLVEPLTEAETLPLAQAFGRTLAAPVCSAGPVPAFDNSAMDGFACRHADLSEGVVLQVVADIPAGSAADPSLPAGTCARIMTGAVVPSEADTIVQVELTSALCEGVRINEVPTLGSHVRRAGEDLAAGQEVLAAGQVLDPRALSLVAAAGTPEVSVRRRPRIAIAATGDELRAPGSTLGRGQIYESNGTFLSAAVVRDGADLAGSAVLPDDDAGFTAGLDALAAEADLVILSGGVSVGDYDVVRIVLSRGESAFRTVKMQPGKPQGWARYQVGDRQVPIICLPGNPLSTAISYELFVRPVIEKMLGEPAQGWETGIADASWKSSAKRRQVIPVVAATDADGVVQIRPAHQHGSASHMVSSLVRANALALVPNDVTQVAVGDVLPFRRLS